MFIIFPFILAIMAFVGVIAFGALSIAFASVSAALSAVNQSTNNKLIKALVIGGGILGFAYIWNDIDLSKERGFEAVFTYAIKVTICLLAAAAMLICSAASLRIAAFLIKKNPNLAQRVNKTLYGALSVGVMAGFGLIIVSKTILEATSEPPPPIALHLDGEPTHCVWRTTKLYKQRVDAQYRPDRYSLKLERGDKVRLDPKVRLTHKVFTVKFQIKKDGELTKVYGHSTNFRLIRDADTDCQW